MALGWSEAGARRVGTGLLFQISLVNSLKWTGMANTEALCSLDSSATSLHCEGKAAGPPLLRKMLEPKAPLDRLGSEAGALTWAMGTSHRETTAKAPTHSAMLTEHLPRSRARSRCWGFSQGQNGPKSCSHGAYPLEGKTQNK